MNQLIVAMFAVSSVFAMMLWRHHRYLQTTARQTNNNGEVSGDQLLGTDSMVSNRPGAHSLVLINLTLITIAGLVYSQLGHFSNWNKGFENEHIDYLIVAQINKDRRLASEQPTNPQVLKDLAHSYVQGGLYREAVETFDQLLAITGSNAEILGLKATSMYYRDGRSLGPETMAVIEEALDLYPAELNTRLLLGTDAFIHSNFDEAIAHWQVLLTNDNQNFNRNAINNAITRAKIAKEG
ncbi:tetratricopeptide repeat protein [Paraferrimonas haliotis]|uniref:Nitrite reductase n=1 Tax=Paraferrimonas haliotis TaxID=2013866 RepID=A0AA37WVL4_9GAMM|nr:nitrite reductase [Paraferrimonas haliotis]GLS82232.1 nitrite reductase [Paraferrimonas haliotis]